nr:dimethylargininase [Jiangella alkaliphila]
MTVNDAPELTRLPSAGPRVATTRDYVMCRPDHFAVHYSINVWMDPARPVDHDRALAQWKTLRATYERLGHRVHQLDPRPGLPDMVFAANGAFVVGDRALGARFRELVRADEAPAHRAWLGAAGVAVTEPVAVNEGEGDFAWAGGRILAGAGFRSDPAAHAELAAVFDVPVVPLELVDPRFYHLDTALAVLDRRTIAYYPPAFAPASQEVLATLFPEAIVATEADALVLGLNAVSDGRHVVLAAQARELADAVARAGFEPVPVDVSELLKSGGGVKCATLELHAPLTAEEIS